MICVREQGEEHHRPVREACNTERNMGKHKPQNGTCHAGGREPGGREGGREGGRGRERERERVERREGQRAAHTPCHIPVHMVQPNPDGQLHVLYMQEVTSDAYLAIPDTVDLTKLT